MRRGRIHLVLVLILVLGAAGSFYAHRTIERQADEVARLRFLSQVEAFTSEFAKYIQNQALIANAFAGLLTTAPNTDQAAFEAFGARVATSYPSVVAVNWFPRTPPAEVARAEAALVAIGAPKPFLRDASGARLAAEGMGRDAFPVMLTTPLQANAVLLGFDVGSSPQRRPALEQARDSGQAVSSEPVKLVQLPDQRGTNLYVPVYRATGLPDQVEVRRFSLAGYISVAFRLNMLVSDAFSDRPELFHVHLLDAGAAAGQRLLARIGPEGLASTATGDAFPPAFERRTVLWGNRPWTMVFEPVSGVAGGAVTWEARLVLLAGLAMTLALAGYLASLDRARRKLRQSAVALAAADRRKGELLSQWNALLENAPVGFAFFDRQHRYVQVNPMLADINGIPAEQHLGRSIEEVLPVNAQSVGPLIEKVFITGQTLRGLEVKGETPSHPGVVRHWLTGFFPVSIGGEVVSVGAVVHEISARKRAEAALKVAKEEAEKANLAKSKFLAAASHDLRQPMQSLFFFSAALAYRLQDDKARATLSMLDRGLETLKTLLDSLLDVSRLDAGVIEAKWESFDLGPWLDHLRLSYEPVVRSKGLELRVGKVCEAWVLSDQNLLGRMVRNLVENAIRYTERGFVAIDCDAKDGRAEITVSDSGIGIPADHLERIWEEFHQVGNDARDRAQGLGLGLAIVRRLSELLDHPVRVRSTPGQGTSFTLSVPMAAAMGAADPSVGPRRLAVLVDDDARLLDGLRTTFEDWNFDVITATTPEEAMARVTASGRAPDFILADYRLGKGRTGAEAIRDLRVLVGREVPGILLTGHGGIDCEREAAEQRLSVAQKPITSGQLRQVLAEHIQAAE